MVEEEGLEPSGGRRLFIYHIKEESNLNPKPISSVFLLVLIVYGSRDGTRTRKPYWASDFKSDAYTDSATQPR